MITPARKSHGSAGRSGNWPTRTFLLMFARLDPKEAALTDDRPSTAPSSSCQTAMSCCTRCRSKPCPGATSDGNIEILIVPRVMREVDNHKTKPGRLGALQSVEPAPTRCPKARAAVPKIRSASASLRDVMRESTNISATLCLKARGSAVGWRDRTVNDHEVRERPILRLAVIGLQDRSDPFGTLV